MTGLQEHDAVTPLGEASAWVARLQGDALTVADGLAFDVWLDAAPDNRAAYIRALAAMHELETAAPQIIGALDSPRRALGRRDLGRPNLGRRSWVAAAGAMAAAATVAALLIVPNLSVRPPQDQTYATVRGQHQSVKLADGSTLDLNAETRLAVRFAPDRRRVTMGDGEVIFDVAADAKRPFEIEAAGQVVRVVGTRFDVRNRPDGLAVVVARGVVQVRRAADSGDTHTYELHPGDRFELATGGAVALGTTDPNEAFGWRIGRMVYRDAPLSRVIEDLNRQFKTPIRIDDAQLERRPISGVLVLDDQDAVLRRLALMLPIKPVRSPAGILLQPR